jgi:hypothetical protein
MKHMVKDQPRFIFVVEHIAQKPLFSKSSNIGYIELWYLLIYYPLLQSFYQQQVLDDIPLRLNVLKVEPWQSFANTPLLIVVSLFDAGHRLKVSVATIVYSMRETQLEMGVHDKFASDFTIATDFICLQLLPPDNGSR